MTAASIAGALRLGRKSGLGWVACCPAHEDHDPSLTLRDADGKVLVNCHAGCKQSAVINALKALGLWPEAAQKPWQRRIVAEYSYTDERGELIYQVVRT